MGDLTNTVPPSHVEVRAYFDADLEAVVRVFTESVHQLAVRDYSALQRAAWAPQAPALEPWARRMSSVTTQVAVDGAEVVAFISHDRAGHIDLLFTAPAHARRGIATRLYRSVEESLLAAGVVEAFTEASLTARPFFERCGFELTREEVVMRHGTALRRFAMRKPLPARDCG